MAAAMLVAQAMTVEKAGIVGATPASISTSRAMLLHVRLGATTPQTVLETVANACSCVGLDPLYVANEGKLLAIVAREDAEEVLAAMRAHPLGADAAVIGECVEDHPGMVVTKTAFGATRVVDTPIGEQLPRIC